MDALKDWTGNTRAVHTPNKRSDAAEVNDYYATDPKAVELLLEQEAFSLYVWEPACGEGHISKVLQAHGFNVRSTDLINRGFGVADVDFLSIRDPDNTCQSDIITNPPYKHAKEFVEQALRLVKPGGKVAMFLKLTFLEGQNRRSLFKRFPPKTVYVSSGRLECGKNGVFTGTSAVAYCWFVWQKGFSGTPEIKWIN